MRTGLLATVAVSLVNSACPTMINMGYVEEVSTKEACGGTTEYCQPQTGPYYRLYKENELRPPIDPAEMIGMSYTGSLLFGGDRCYTAVRDVHYIITENSFDATVKSEYVAKIKASLLTDFGTKTANLDSKLKAEARATFGYALEKFKAATAKVKVTTYNAPVTFWLDPAVKACQQKLAELPGRALAVVGVTVVSIPSVNWTATIKEEIAAALGVDVTSKLATFNLGFDFKDFLEQNLQGVMTNWATVWATTSMGPSKGGVQQVVDTQAPFSGSMQDALPFVVDASSR